MWPWEWDRGEWVAAVVSVSLMVFFAFGTGMKDGGGGPTRGR